jgi:hypothetical protein
MHADAAGWRLNSYFVNRRSRVQIPSPAPVLPKPVYKQHEGHRLLQVGGLQTPRKTAVFGKSVALGGQNSLLLTHPEENR